MNVQLLDHVVALHTGVSLDDRGAVQIYVEDAVLEKFAAGPFGESATSVPSHIDAVGVVGYAHAFRDNPF